MDTNLTLEQLRAGDMPEMPTRSGKGEIKWWQTASVPAANIFYDDFAINKGEMTIGTMDNVVKADSNGLYVGNRVWALADFRVDMSGNAYLTNAHISGDITALTGTIGGFTITPLSLYGGEIKTGVNAGAGGSGVVMNTDGLKGYSSTLGETFSIPTDGSAPSFSSGVIENTIFEVNTNSVIRTSEDVGLPSGISVLISDNFNDNTFDTDMWTRTNSTNIVETNNQLEITTDLGSGYFDVNAKDTVDLTGKLISIKLVSTTSEDLESYEGYPLQLTNDASNKLLFLISYGGIVCIRRQGGSNTEVSNVEYNSTNHKYLRIRESSGTVYFDYSADGETWSSFGNTTVTFSLSNLAINISAGHWGTESEVSKMVVDDFAISESASDGGQGVLINDTGFYACKEGQTLENANVKILTTGEAVFSGSVKGGMTDYMTGDGYFMGQSGGIYKLSVGSPSGNYMSWDNEQLRIKGIIELDGPINLEGYATADLPIPPSSPGLTLPTEYS